MKKLLSMITVFAVLCPVLYFGTVQAANDTSPTVRPTTSIASNDPILTEFIFDQGGAMIQMTFDQNVLAKSLDITMFHLQSDKVFVQDVTETFNITNFYNDLDLLGNTTDVVIYFTQPEFYRLRLYPLLGSSNMTTYLSIDRGAIYSSESENSNAEYSSTDAFQVTTYVKDILPPFVVQYTLDMNSGVMNLTFSEPINNSTFQLDGLAFQNIRNNYLGTGSYVKLINQGYSIILTGIYNLQLSVHLGTENLNLLKILGNLCINPSTTFLSSWQPFVNDTAGNPINLVAFDKFSGMATDFYTYDITPPSLLSWAFSYNTGVLVLYFSEVVDLAFFNYSKISFSSSKIVDSSTVLLNVGTPGPPVALRASFMNLTIFGDELNNLKSQTVLFRNISTTYLVLGASAVVDAAELANNYLGVDATSTNAMKIGTLQQDTIPPVVSFFTVNLTAHTLSITFSEIVSIGTFQLSAITVQNSSLNAFVSVTLTSSLASVLTLMDAVTIEVELSTLGFATIITKGSLCVSLATCYISYTSSLVKDKALVPNSAVPLVKTNGLKASSFNPNYNVPSLLSWGIDMSNEIIFLNFSEPVNTTSLLLTSIFLSSDALIDSSTILKYTKSSSYVLSSELANVVIQLSYDDAVEIKGQPPLCTIASRCFLSASVLLGFSVTTFSDTSAVQIANSPVYGLDNGLFVPDTKPPELLSFSADMSVGTLTLRFSEVVRGQKISTTGLVLYGFGTRAGAHVRLNLGSYGVQFYAANVTIVLSYYDYIAVKLFGTKMASSRFNTFLELDGASVKDMAGNFIVGGTLTLASSVTEDSKAPSVLSFFYDRTSVNLTVYFNDVIQVSDIDLTGFSLYSSPYTISKVVTLSGGLARVGSADNINAVVIMLKSAAEIFSANSIGKVLVQASTSLFISKAAILVDTPLSIPILAGTAAKALLEGQTPLTFRLDMNAGTVIVEFPYDGYSGGLTLVATGIALRSSVSSVSYTLTAVNSYTFSTGNETGRILFFSFTTSDFSAIDLLFPYPKREEISLYLAKTALLDSRSFTLSSSLLLPCKQLIQNTIPPVLQSYTLNMNTGTK
jgi:hypothetical protein